MFSTFSCFFHRCRNHGSKVVIDFGTFFIDICIDVVISLVNFVSEKHSVFHDFEKPSILDTMSMFFLRHRRKKTQYRRLWLWCRWQKIRHRKYVMISLPMSYNILLHRNRCRNMKSFSFIIRTDFRMMELQQRTLLWTGTNYWIRMTICMSLTTVFLESVQIFKFYQWMAGDDIR